MYCVTWNTFLRFLIPERKTLKELAGVGRQSPLERDEKDKGTWSASRPVFFLLVTLARTGKSLEDDGLSGRGREVA